jgi:hypothetical protein
MKSDALLTGRIYDDRGNRMSPSHTRKGNVRIPPVRGLFARNEEISALTGLRGGAGRPRTSNQAVMSRHRGLGRLELATKRLSAASSGY